MLREVNVSEIGYSLLLNSDDYIRVATPKAKLKFVNKAYADFFHKTQQELIGTNFMDTLQRERAQEYANAIRLMAPVAPTVTFTYKYTSPEGEKWVHWKETGIFNEQGILTELLSVGKNVSNVVEERREKEILLATLTAFKQAIDTNIICTITDAKGVITYANDRFCQISKYTKEELLGKTHNIVNSNHHPKSYFTNLWKTIISGKAWSGEIKNKAKDGTCYWVQSAIIPIKNTKGIISGYLSLRTLIDEQKKLEETKNTYLKTIENMLFTVSHEIRRPITTCQGLLYLIQDSMLSSEEEYNEAITYLVSSTTELDSYSRKLNEYLENNLKIVQQ